MLIKSYRLITIICLILSGLSLPGAPAHAITSDDKHCALDGYGCTYYLQNDCPDSAGNPSDAPTGPAYILGDSITVRSETAYTQAFQAAGNTVNIDASVDRSVTVPGQDGVTGLKAIANDKDEITQSGVIIIALGTNGLGGTLGGAKQEVDDTIKAIRADNLTAPIYWVDTFTLNRSDYNKSTIRIANQAIYDEAQSQNYKTISWAHTVDPNVNPQTPDDSPSNPSDNMYNDRDPNGYIFLGDGINVHPTLPDPSDPSKKDGVDALVKLVVSSVGSSQTTQPPTSKVNITTKKYGTLGATVYAPADNNKYPLIMFAPGRFRDSSESGLYGSYLKAIAAQGFVVAGADFPDNTTFGAISGDATDVKTLIGKVEGDFQDRINTANGVGMLGHSDGAVIALMVGYATGIKDQRITAVMAADGAFYSSASDYGNGPPLFLMHGTADTIQPIGTGSDPIYANLNSNNYIAYAKIQGADHYHYIVQDDPSFQATSTAPHASAFQPMVDNLTAAYFKRVIGGVSGSTTSLSSQVSQHYNNLVTFQENGDDSSIVGATNVYGGPSGPPAGAACCAGSGQTNTSFGPGVLPSYIKAPYNGIFTAAGKKFNVDPGVLVGIFYNEQYGYNQSLTEFNKHDIPVPPPPYGSSKDNWAYNTASNDSGNWPTGSPEYNESVHFTPGGQPIPGGGGSPSGVGARGPVQFEPGTWAGDGVDGNGDGTKNALDLTDEIFGESKFLAAAGATNPETESKVETAATHYSGGYPLYSQNTFAIFKQIKADEGGSATQPTPADPITTIASDCTGSNPTGSNIYEDPFHDQTNVGARRIDSGADFVATTTAGVPVYAIGTGIINQATAHGTFYPQNPGWISYQLTDPRGSAYKKYVYVSEGCPPQPGIGPGKIVTTSTLLCYMQPSSIEMGWAMNATEELAMAYGHYTESYATVYGQNFYELLQSLGMNVKECYDHPGITTDFNDYTKDSPPIPPSLPPAWVPNPDTTKEGSNACN